MSKMKTNTLDWNDKLWDDWQDLWTSSLNHFICSHNWEESVRIHLFSQAIEENWQEEMVIELFWAGLPQNLIDWSLMIDLDRKITTIVVSISNKSHLSVLLPSEFRSANGTSCKSTCNWCWGWKLWLSSLKWWAATTIAWRSWVCDTL